VARLSQAEESNQEMSQDPPTAKSPLPHEPPAVVITTEVLRDLFTRSLYIALGHRALCIALWFATFLFGMGSFTSSADTKRAKQAESMLVVLEYPVVALRRFQNSDLHGNSKKSWADDVMMQGFIPDGYQIAWSLCFGMIFQISISSLAGFAAHLTRP
jgi:hypothetical protein